MNIKENIRVLTTVSLYHAFNDGSVTVLPLLFPIFRILFDLSYTEIGIITGGSLLVTLISQFVLGRISDQYSQRMVLSMGMLLLSGSLLLLTQARSFLSLLVLISLLRFAASFYHPIGIGWVSRVFKKDRLDWAMGTQSAFGNFGSFIAILTTLFVAEYTSWSYPLFFWAIAGICCSMFGIVFTKKISEEYQRVKQKKSIQKPGFRVILGEVKELAFAINVLIPGFMISGSAWGLTITYLPLLLVERTTLSLTVIGGVVATWIGVGTIICLIYGRISNLIGRKTILIASYACMGVISLLFCVVVDVLFFLVLMVLFGIVTFLTFPALFSYVSEKTHESAEGKTFGYTFTFQLGGGTVLLFLSGLFSDIFGIWIPFAFLGGLSLCTCVFLFVFKRKLQT